MPDHFPAGSLLKPTVAQLLDLRTVERLLGLAMARGADFAEVYVEFGRKLAATVEVDPALIGGIRVVVGDEVLDTSVKARLEQMKVALTA